MWIQYPLRSAEQQIICRANYSLLPMIIANIWNYRLICEENFRLEYEAKLHHRGYFPMLCVSCRGIVQLIAIEQVVPQLHDYELKLLSLDRSPCGVP